MSEISPVYEGKVVHAGIFNFKAVYQFLYDWFIHYQYTVFEKKYSEKVRADGKEVEVIWTCLRKISDYFRFQIKITMRVLRMVPVEVMQNGNKIQKDKGEVEIKFNSFLERDYEHKWETNPISKFLRGLYDKYLIKTRIEAYEDRLTEEVEDMISQAKSYLALEGKR